MRIGQPYLIQPCFGCQAPSICFTILGARKGRAETPWPECWNNGRTEVPVCGTHCPALSTLPQTTKQRPQESLLKFSLRIRRPRGGCKSEGLALNSCGFFASHLQRIHGPGEKRQTEGRMPFAQELTPPFWPGCLLWALLSIASQLEESPPSAAGLQFTKRLLEPTPHSLSCSALCPPPRERATPGLSPFSHPHHSG